MTLLTYIGGGLMLLMVICIFMSGGLLDDTFLYQIFFTFGAWVVCFDLGYFEPKFMIASAAASFIPYFLHRFL